MNAKILGGMEKLEQLEDNINLVGCVVALNLCKYKI